MVGHVKFDICHAEPVVSRNASFLRGIPRKLGRPGFKYLLKILYIIIRKQSENFNECSGCSLLLPKISRSNYSYLMNFTIFDRNLCMWLSRGVEEICLLQYMAKARQRSR